VIISSASHFRVATRTVPLVKRLMPPDGSIDGFVDAVASHRGRPIDVVAAHLGARSSSGFWVGGQGQDYIVYAASATPEQRVVIVCHELAHLLLGHANDGTPGANGVPGIATAGRTRLLTRHGYGADSESEARHLAQRMAALLAARQRHHGVVLAAHG
jgi:hypothetical protein